MICECGSGRIQWNQRLTDTICPDCGGKNYHVIEEDNADPCGSCDECGVNLYSWNDPLHCDQCEFMRGHA